MPAPLETVLVCTLLPTAATVVGGTIAAFRPPGPRLRSSIQHFAAGVVFAVVAVELLPDLRRQHYPAEVAVSFGLGVAGMLSLRYLTRKGQQSENQGGGWSWALLVPTGIDLLLDGLLLGIGFAAGSKEGTLLALALTAECLSLGLATSASLAQGNRSPRGPVIAATVGLAIVFALGAAVGVSLIQGLSGHALAWMLAFGCAALLYLVTEELLVEAHEVPETAVATALFFAGFLLLLILGMLE